MSPATTAVAPDVEDVVRAIFRAKLPRTKPEDVEVLAQGDALFARVIPDHVVWSVTLGPRTAVLRRCDPDTKAPLVSWHDEEVAIPPPPAPSVPEDPRAARLLARAARVAAEQLVQATHRARVSLQHVCLEGEPEVQRLVGSVRVLDPASARSRLTADVAGGLGAFIEFSQTLAEGERLLAAHREQRAETSSEIATKRLQGSITEIARLRRRDPERAAQTDADVALLDAVREATDFKDAFASAATILAQAGAAAAVQLQVHHVTEVLAGLKAELARVRQSALELDGGLLAALALFAESTKQPVVVPRLMWAQPKDLHAPPTVAEG